jgi:hypothetical protein
MRILRPLAIAAAAVLAGCSGAESGGTGTDGGGFTPQSSLDGSYVVQRMGSIECYTFAGATVELRHGGNAAVTDVGTYTPATGSVSWSSGRSSTVEGNSAGIAISGVQASEIQTCVPGGSQ